jgi:RNA polymerase sigma-70 factor (ECF subfamily)
MAAAGEAANGADMDSPEEEGPSDEAIVGALRLRGREGEVLFTRYRLHVRRVLLNALGADAELSDLVQDVFVSALASIDQLKEPTLLKRWLSSIAIYRARARMRELVRSRAVRLVPDEELEPLQFAEPSLEMREALGKTRNVLSTIGADLRHAFLLRFVDELDLNGVADALGVSVSTGKRRVRRAAVRFDTLARLEPALSDWRGGDRSFRKRSEPTMPDA